MSSSTAAPAPYTKMLGGAQLPWVSSLLTCGSLARSLLLVIFDGTDTVRLDAGLSVCGGVAIAPGMLLGDAGRNCGVVIGVFLVAQWMPHWVP